jgi:hypothetical protein
MHLIVYASRAVHSFKHKDLTELRAFSASVNRVTGVTGLLVYDGSRFLQALEGDYAAVNATMNRIKMDPRHDRIVLTEDRETTARQFASWSTEYRDPDEPLHGSAFLDRVKAKVVDVEDDATKAAFIGFAALSLKRWTSREL